MLIPVLSPEPPAPASAWAARLLWVPALGSLTQITWLNVEKHPTRMLNGDKGSLLKDGLVIKQPRCLKRSSSCCASPAQQFPTPPVPILALKKACWGCFTNPHFFIASCVSARFPSLLFSAPQATVTLGRVSLRLPKACPSGLQANVHLLIKIHRL